MSTSTKECKKQDEMEVDVEQGAEGSSGDKIPSSIEETERSPGKGRRKLREPKPRKPSSPADRGNADKTKVTARSKARVNRKTKSEPAKQAAESDSNAQPPTSTPEPPEEAPHTDSEPKEPETRKEKSEFAEEDVWKHPWRGYSAPLYPQRDIEPPITTSRPPSRHHRVPLQPTLSNSRRASPQSFFHGHRKTPVPYSLPPRRPSSSSSLSSLLSSSASSSSSRLPLSSVVVSSSTRRSSSSSSFVRSWSSLIPRPRRISSHHSRSIVHGDDGNG
ncbi:uncharacterized protein JCM6883_003930 [Sporobolomyces salmoneus]|uniref:uncharacterized protein n=1 Tax=Sporobolomyces salmoneus TaxID=183962 RepID=UPI00316D926F